MTPAGSRVVIRVAKSNDALFLEQIEGVSFDGDRLSRRAIRHHLQSPTAGVFIAMLDGKPAGYAMMFYRTGILAGRLYSIATLPAARGRGIGARLLGACEQAARRRGCDRLRLEVHEHNRAAIALYETSGYARFGRHERYYHDGADAIRLEKPLRMKKRLAV